MQLSAVGGTCVSKEHSGSAGVLYCLELLDKCPIIPDIGDMRPASLLPPSYCVVKHYACPDEGREHQGRNQSPAAMSVIWATARSDREQLQQILSESSTVGFYIQPSPAALRLRGRNR